MTITGHKRHQRRKVYTGGSKMRGIMADHSGPAGHLDPHRKGTGAGRCACGSFFVLYGAARAECYGCRPRAADPS